MGARVASAHSVVVVQAVCRKYNLRARTTSAWLGPLAIESRVVPAAACLGGGDTRRNRICTWIQHKQPAAHALYGILYEAVRLDDQTA